MLGFSLHWISCKESADISFISKLIKWQTQSSCTSWYQSPAFGCLDKSGGNDWCSWESVLASRPDLEDEYPSRCASFLSRRALLGAWVLQKHLQYFLRIYSSLDKWRKGGRGQGLSSFGGAKTLTFSGICRSSAALSTCGFTEAAVGHAKRDVFSIRWENESINEADSG